MPVARGRLRRGAATAKRDSKPHALAAAQSQALSATARSSFCTGGHAPSALRKRRRPSAGRGPHRRLRGCGGSFRPWPPCWSVFRSTTAASALFALSNAHRCQRGISAPADAGAEMPLFSAQRADNALPVLGSLRLRLRVASVGCGLVDLQQLQTVHASAALRRTMKRGEKARPIAAGVDKHPVRRLHPGRDCRYVQGHLGEPLPEPCCPHLRAARAGCRSKRPARDNLPGPAIA